MGDWDSPPVENVPDWEEDGNSPVTVTNASSASITLAGTYDEVVIRVKMEPPAGTFASVICQINGDTGTNYRQFNVDGTTNTGASKWKITQADDAAPIVAGAWITGRWGNEAVIRNPRGVLGNGSASMGHGGDNSAVTSPLDSITVSDDGGNTMDAITLEVFGRDIA